MKRSSLQMQILQWLQKSLQMSSRKEWLKEKWKISEANAFKNLHKFCELGTNVGATTLSITTFSIMALSIKGLCETLSINGNRITMLCTMLSVLFIVVLSVIVLIGTMLSVVMVTVVILSVVVPKCPLLKYILRY
jgi:hypothetical protein